MLGSDEESHWEVYAQGQRESSCQYATFYNYFYSFLFYTKKSHWEVMHRGREKAVANTPHFTIIFTVFYFIQKHFDTRRKTLHLLLPLPPPTRPSPTHPLPKTLTHPPFDPHPTTLCPRPSPTHPLPKVLLLVLYFICLHH